MTPDPPTAREPVPFIVRVIGLLCITYGVASGVHMVATLLQGSFQLDLGVLAIWFGRGLLFGNRTDRLWIMAFAVIAWIVVLPVFYNAWQDGSFAGPGKGLIAADLTATALFYGLILVGLAHPRIRAWFRQQDPDETEIRESTRWALAALVAGVFVSFGNELKEGSMQHLMASTYALHTTFSGVDAATGKAVAVNGISQVSPTSSYFVGERPIPPTLSVRSGVFHEQGELQMLVQSILTKPLQLSITSHGMKPVIFTVDSKTPDNITVSFEREGPTEKEGS